MGVNADSVIIPVEADLSGLTDRVRAGTAQFDAAMDRMEQSSGKAEQAIAGASKKMGANIADVGMRSRQLGMQIGQMGSSIASGGGIMMAVAQQASDFAYVLGGAEGAAGKVAAFFSGPWGAALLAAASVLGVLISKHMEAKDKVDAHGVAVKSLKQAIDDLHKSTKAAITSQEESNRLTEISAKQQTAAAYAVRQRTQALLQQALAQRETDLLSASDRKSGQVPESVQRVEELRRLLKENTAQLDEAREAWRQSMIPNMLNDVEAATDKAKKAASDYEHAMTRLNAQFTAPGSKMARQEYERQAAALLKVKKAAEDAAAAEKTAADQAASNARRDAGNTARFQMPVQGRITGQFGESRTGHQHQGLDIAVPVGTRVGAAQAGVVIEAGQLPGYGNVIYIDHGGGTITRYGHLSQIMATKGQQVGQGEIIGLSGGAKGAPGSGDSQGPHVHYEVRQGGRAVNPAKGEFRVDPGGTGDKAEALQRQAEAAAAKAEREQQKRDAQVASFNDEMAQLDQQKAQATAKEVHSAEEQLAVDEEAIKLARDRQDAQYIAAAQAGRLTDLQAALLVATNDEVAAARIAAARRKAAEGTRQEQYQLESSDLRNQIDLEHSNDDLAKTAKQRKDHALVLLDLSLKLEKLELENVIASTTATEAQKEIARRRLAILEQLGGAAARQIGKDNRGPGEIFRDEVNKTGGEIGEAVDGIAVDGLKSLNSELAKAIMGTETLGAAFKHVAAEIIEALINIAIQQAIIKPLANLLWPDAGGAGGGSSGGGIIGLLASFGASLIGGGGALPNTPGLAGGGDVNAGQTYLVGEEGPELFKSNSPGRIVPHRETARQLAGGAGGPGNTTVALTINAPGATAETVAMIDRRIREAAPTLVSAAQRATMKTLTRTRT
jgi:murein DD-endopeptidase MepM/ murein hydrolase activator NlpD